MLRSHFSCAALGLLINDAEACIALFAHWRWSSQGFVCPHCESRRASRIRTRPSWRCLACNRQTRLTAGTAIHGSHVSLPHWIYAIFTVAQRKTSISAKRLVHDLGVGYTTAWSMLQRIRRFLAEKPLAQLRRGLVEVASFTVHEIDARPHPHTEDACPTSDTNRVFIGIERLGKGDELRHLRFGRLRVAAVTSAVPVSTFVSLHAPAAVRVEQFLKPITGVVFHNLVASLRGTFHGVSRKHLPAYVREYVFRFNRRRRPDILPTFLGRRLARGAPLARAALRTTPPDVDPPMRVIADEAPLETITTLADEENATYDATLAALDELRKLHPKADPRTIVKMAMERCKPRADDDES